MNSNREILNHCPNYYKIVNFDYNENDLMSEKLITIYKKYVFSKDITNTEEVNRLERLDKVFNSYINDYTFRSTLQKAIVKIEIKDRTNILRTIVENILKIFSNYEEYTTKRIYISKWI